LQDFFDAVKGGDASRQYALLSIEDKQFFATEHAYESSGLVHFAHGYTERIENVNAAPEIPDAKDRNIVTIKATIGVRPPSDGKQLYETNTAKSFTDTFKLRKDAGGVWKMWLSGSGDHGRFHMFASPPSAQSNF
jgi:hypothetical protein